MATLKHLSIVRANNTLATSGTDSELHNAFSKTITLPVVNHDSEGGTNKDHGQVMRTWLGNLDADKHDQEYAQRRGQLSHAAKYADWDKVFHLLEVGRKTYGESWVNAPRMSEYLSTYITLHCDSFGPLRSEKDSN